MSWYGPGGSAHQLRCAGVLEAIRISRLAYPNRMPHMNFISRYHLIGPDDWSKKHMSEATAADAAGVVSPAAACNA